MVCLFLAVVCFAHRLSRLNSNHVVNLLIIRYKYMAKTSFDTKYIPVFIIRYSGYI